MTRFKRILLVIFCLLSFSNYSCKKDKSDEINNSSTGYLIFGHYYGMCQGENCIEIFKLEQSQLMEDSNDKYPTSNKYYVGHFIPLSVQKFNEIKDLKNYFPSDLLNEPEHVIGMPDAGDWGGLYIEYNFNGVRNFWLVDQMKSNVPVKYHEFIDKMNEKINLLE